MDAPDERVFFRSDPEVFARACDAFENLRCALAELLPDARIEHVGGTAVPGLLTKGDLDIQIIVSADAYEHAKEVLASRFNIHEGAFASDTACSFKDDDADPPLGIHLTIKDSPDDFQWRNRDLLLARPDLVKELAALKLRHHGGSMETYRDEKAQFFERLGQRSASDGS